VDEALASKEEIKRMVDTSSDGGSKSRLYFDDGPPAEYLTFKAAAQAQLRFKDKTKQEEYLCSLLGSKALQRAYALTGDSVFGSASLLWTKLDALFGGRSPDDALNELDRLRQGSKTFETFISEFTDLSAQAGLTEAELRRRIRIQVNGGLQRYLIPASQNATFNELTALARRVTPLAEQDWNRQKKNLPGGHKRERVNAVTTGGKFTGLCYNCQTVCGNSAKNCKLPKKARPEQKGRKAQAGTDAAKALDGSDDEEPEN
jgi:hypothetical protein